MRQHYRLVVKSSCSVAALWLCAIPCLGQQAPPGSAQPGLKEVLSWLPGDTETIIGTNGPFPLPNFDEIADNDSEQAALSATELELRIRGIPLGLLAFKNGRLQKLLHGQGVTLAVEGSRHFRPPAVLGGMRHEGCAILVFDSGTSLDHDSFMKNAARSAVRFEDMAGAKIAVFNEPQENDVWTTFVAFPRRNIVLVATNADYLRNVLARMGGASGPRALPETLPEWKYVKTQAPVWGLRHYRKAEAGLDPTSPFGGRNAANRPDEMAVGFAFCFEPFVRKAAVLTYLSANANARQILQEYLGMADAKSASPREFQVRFRVPAPGVTEGSVTLSVMEALQRFLFGLLAMLGQAIYV